MEIQNRVTTRRNFVAVSAAAIAGIALAGCAGGSQEGSASSASASSQATSAAASSAQGTTASDAAAAGAQEAAASSAVANASGSELSSEASEAAASQPAPDTTAAAGSNVLVACFSATGNTRGVAEKIAGNLGADYVEIEPAEPYTDDDLNYSDESTRATVEQNDSAVRPTLAAMPDFSAYDVVFLGHPIWWGRAPRIICTLLEGSDLAGKRVAEFCTSGSSGVEGATGELRGLAPSADWIGAQRFAAGADDADVAEWVDSLGVK